MTTRGSGRRGARQRGTTIVEMAVVAPVVLILLIGTMDLGIAVYAYNTMAEAARAGTRYAAVHGSKAKKQAGPAANDPEVEKTVRAYAPGVIASDLTVASSWPDGDNEPGSRVTVTVNYDYRPATTWIIGFTKLKLGSSSTMYISN